MHHRLRLARRWLAYAVTIVLVLMALGSAVVSQLLPLAERHPDHVAAWLGDRIGRPVAFDHLETQWTRRGPLLRLDGLRVGEGDKAIRIGDAEMLISQYAGLFPGQSFTQLRLHALELTLERSDDGRWHVRGLPGEQQGGSEDPFESLEGLGELQVIDGKLTILAPQLHINAHLTRVDVRLRVDGDRVRAGMRAWMQVGKSPLVAVADFGREQGNGHAYFAAKQADMTVWGPLLHLAGVSATAGQGRAEAWAQLQNHRVAGLQVRTVLEGVALQGAPLEDGSVPRLQYPHLDAQLDWRASADGWRLDVPRLRLGEAVGANVLDGLALRRSGQRYAGMADHVDAAPLLSIAALSDRMAPVLRQWIVAAKPQAKGNDIRLGASSGGKMLAQGHVSGVGFNPVGDAPGMQGLGGTLQGDDAGFALKLDDAALLRFDWPRGFGVTHDAHLHGTVAGWREGAGWRVGTSSLHVQGEDFGTKVRGGLWFQGDGTRPWIDIAADVDSTQVVAAKGFWIHHMMSPATVDWLDTALVSGSVEDGHALISGDLDDWPFRDHDGRFEATARIRDATIKFHKDWPLAQHMDADVRFIASGFDVAGKAVLAGVGIQRFDAAIPDFGHAELSIHAEGGGDASQLLGLARQSPLQKTYGETLDNIDASGPASVSFDLAVPLHGAGSSKLGGTVALSGAKLAEKRWNLAFSDVRGRARYDQGGFVADKLAVKYGSRPGTLSLRAGDHVRDSGQGFEATLDTMVDARELLKRAPQMDWLQPYVSGQSSWSIAVSIPKAVQARTRNPATAVTPPARLRLDSNLVGTALTLPAPLDKPARTALATRVDTRLPLDQGEIAVAFGKRLALRARSNDRGTGVRVALGSDQVAEPPPASGLVATGHAGTLDLIDWAMLSGGSGASASGKVASGNVAGGKGGTDKAGTGKTGSGKRTADSSGLSLRSIDVTTDHLHLLGADFPGIRVRANPVAGATRLQLDGTALAGVVQLSQADGAAISGQLQRLYWHKAGASDAGKSDTGRPTADKPAAGKQVAKTNAADQPPDDVDPSKVPPLDLRVDDLRFGDARMGNLVLRTHPTTAGLHVDQLQARAPGHDIDVTGDWTGRKGATRTHMGVRIDSEDFGALLAGFGYGDQLSRGDGKATLDAAWAGSPAAFKLDALDGSFTLDVRDGQLVEVEPGAGRVLGLFSLAQLPRRLTLDFRDFFSKGFAFDKLAGDVRVGDGKARTDNLVIDGPSARIQISGSADLRAQTFDQTLLVLPKTGNLLTAVGAIAGGPVGAAIGAAANAVLRKPLGEMGAKTYHVSGPWKDPKVEVTTREQSRRDAAKPAVPPG